MNKPQRRERAFENGFKAYARNKPVDANPYRRSALALAWVRGWREAEHYARQVLAARERAQAPAPLVAKAEVLVPES